MSTVYEHYKSANEIKQPRPKSGGKGISSTKTCEYSENRRCILSEDSSFPCEGLWWESCGIRYRVKNGLPLGDED